MAPSGCDNFSDFPCCWWHWQFWGVLVRYLWHVPLLGFLLTVGVRLYVLRRRATEAECHFHIVSRARVSVTCHCWCWPWSPGWGVCQVSPLWSPPLPFSFPHRNSQCATHTLGVRAVLHLLEGRVPTEIIWNYSPREICLFSSIYLFIQSFIYVGTDSWVFILCFEL